MQGLTLPLTAIVLGASAWAVREDLLAHRIPNGLTGPLLAIGIALQCAADGWSGLGQACLGALVGLAMLMPFYVLRAMGAGDVKLLAALGAALGPHWAFVAGVITLTAGGILAIAYVFLCAARAALQPAAAPWSTRLMYARICAQQLRRERFPYALAIAVGAIWAVTLRGDLRAVYDFLAGAQL
jgi:prepilin peptidase CpaA